MKFGAINPISFSSKETWELEASKIQSDLPIFFFPEVRYRIILIRSSYQYNLIKPLQSNKLSLYRYFYTWGYIYPDSASVFIALDECTKETGCLQIIKGSHHMGRINHFVTGKMLQADPEIVAEVRRRMV